MEQPVPTARDVVDRAMKPFALPLGLASPMWLAYGAAASVGATWWWMSRMSRFVAPHMGGMVNAEAIAAEAPPPSVPATVEPFVATAEPVVEAVEAWVDAASLASADPVVDTVEAHAEPVVPAAATMAIEPAASPATDETANEQFDELTLLRGVGPRVADALVARGVTTFAQLAIWTEAELAAFDTELKLLGRSKRYDFLGQARELAGKA